MKNEMEERKRYTLLAGAVVAIINLLILIRTILSVCFIIRLGEAP
jgi:hypothetical protein